MSARDVVAATQMACSSHTVGQLTADAILSALTAAGYVVEQGWQDIATAPRDGTPVLAYAPATDPVKWAIDLPSLICAAAYHDDAGWCVCTCREVTHWRPLPAPPKGDAT